ncbi:hypothetical protein MRX96_009691 [Rhipicephalus microplus]
MAVALPLQVYSVSAGGEAPRSLSRCVPCLCGSRSFDRSSLDKCARRVGRTEDYTPFASVRAYTAPLLLVLARQATPDPLCDDDATCVSPGRITYWPNYEYS